MPERAADGLAARRRPYRPLPLLPTEQRHLASRFSFGVTPAMAAEVRRAGGARAWFDEQLAAPLGDRPADETLAWFPTLRQAPREAWNAAKDGRIKGYVVMADYQRYAMVRRIRARHQVREVMTEFWEQLLNVPTTGEPWFVHRRDYGDTLRKLAFTSYENILRAAVLHPSMLVYLDNARSTAAHPNENLGRELLELHTVGRGNYDEAQVKDSARILTGWAVDTMEGNRDPSWVAWYSAKDHWTGPGAGARLQRRQRASGRQAAHLRLPALPGPPPADRAAAGAPAGDEVRRRRRRTRRWWPASPRSTSTTSTAIVPVLRALVDSPEFARSRGAKVRDPAEDVVATYRVLQVALRRPTRRPLGGQHDDVAVAHDRADAASPGRVPTARRSTTRSWSTPARLLASYRIHQNMSGGYYPTQDCRYRPRRAWLPRLPVPLRPGRRPPLAPAAAPAGHPRAGARLQPRRPTSASANGSPAPPPRQVRRAKVILTMLDSPDFFLR